MMRRGSAALFAIGAVLLPGCYADRGWVEGQEAGKHPPRTREVVEFTRSEVVRRTHAIAITSEPPGAVVEVDGHVVGRTPCEVTAPYDARVRFEQVYSERLEWFVPGATYHHRTNPGWYVIAGRTPVGAEREQGVDVDGDPAVRITLSAPGCRSESRIARVPECVAMHLWLHPAPADPR